MEWDGLLVAGIVVLLALLVLFAISARRLERLWVTGPMLFLVAGAILGPKGVAFIDVAPSIAPVRVFAEITLVLLLFSDATTVDAPTLKHSYSAALRLLVIALPLAVLFGAGAAMGMFAGLDLGTAALLAAILAPTDLSLGLTMFQNPDVPALVRKTLNVESGLNDGVASPFVALFIALSLSESVGDGSWLAGAATEILMGVVAGIVIGSVGGYLIRIATSNGWTVQESLPFAAFSLAILCYVTATAIGGNGFIGAFVGGLAYRVAGGKAVQSTTEFAERSGTLMTLVVWTIFGAFASVELGGGVAWLPILYALLSLLLIRTLSVWVSLLGMKSRWETVAFMGWFGPRGLASVVFLLTAYDALSSSGVDTTILLSTVSWTILLSVLLHGLSATPIAAWYGKRATSFPDDAWESGKVMKRAAVHHTYWHGRSQLWSKAESTRKRPA